MTAATNTPSPYKTVTKIVTFYSDGTFSEYTPSMPPNPFTVPAQPYTPSPYPWWQGPVSYGWSGQPIPCSQMWGTPTEGKSE